MTKQPHRCHLNGLQDITFAVDIRSYVEIFINNSRNRKVVQYWNEHKQVVTAEREVDQKQYNTIQCKSNMT